MFPCVYAIFTSPKAMQNHWRELTRFLDTFQRILKTRFLSIKVKKGLKVRIFENCFTGRGGNRETLLSFDVVESKLVKS